MNTSINQKTLQPVKEIHNQIDDLIDKLSNIDWVKLSRFEKSTLSDQIKIISDSIKSISQICTTEISDSIQGK